MNVFMLQQEQVRIKKKHQDPGSLINHTKSLCACHINLEGVAFGIPELFQQPSYVHHMRSYFSLYSTMFLYNANYNK
jgi:hypothetical protein